MIHSSPEESRDLLEQPKEYAHSGVYSSRAIMEGVDNCFKVDSQGDVRIQIRAQPRASADRIEGLHGQALKIRLAAPPVEGKANARLIRFLADQLHLKPSQLILETGDSSRNKCVRVIGLSLAGREALIARLRLLAG